MAQSKHQIQAILAEAGSEPRPRFGQNFMIDQNLVRIVADAGQITPGDWVLEVGPGTGTLTEELLLRGAEVVAVEIDRDLAACLRARFAGRAEFTLIEGDALAGKHHLNPLLLESLRNAAGRSTRLVANLPYNIASPLAIDLLIAGVGLLAFTVQKEVADRLRAGVGDDAYGPLSVMAQLLSHVEVLRTLGPKAFWPAPKIDSALVRMIRQDRLGGHAAEFSVFVHQIFGARRKMLRKGLIQMEVPEVDALLTSLGIDGRRRPEELSPEELLRLFDAARASLIPMPRTRKA